MKCYSKIFVTAFLLCFLTRCGMQEGEEGQLHMYGLFNRSSHVVAVVHRPSCIEMPDSLILQSGDEFVFEEGVGYVVGIRADLKFFDSEGYDSRLVYYNGRYVIRFEDLPFRQQPTTYTNFWEGMPIHTFTDDDYAYAVEHGTDLGAE